MSTADTLLALLAIAFVAWIVWEFHRAPTERDDMTRGQQEAAAETAADSIRQQLERDDELLTYTRRPHVKAGTAWGRQV